MLDISHSPPLRAAKQDGWSVSGIVRRAVVACGADPRGTDLGNWQIAALFILLAAITSIPVALHPWPPLSDYINHLARMHVIAAGNADPDLSRFYQVDWQLIPNLLMDLIVPPLERVMNVYLAGQVYTVTCFVLILSGTLVLNRCLFGRWSALPLIAFPLLYNRLYLVGTMNFVFGIGLALWALAAWVALRERAAPLRLAVSTVFVLVLFISHLFSVGIYGLGILTFELQRLITRWARPGERDAPARADRSSTSWSWALLDFVASGLPFLPVLPLLLASPTLKLGVSFEWDIHGKLDGILYVINVYSPAVAFVLTAAVAVVLVWVVWRRALRFHRFGWVLLAVGGTIYLAMPRTLFDTYMADQRLPIALAFMIVASASLTLSSRLARAGFAAAVVLLVTLRVGEVESAWHELALGSDAFRQSVEQIDRGSKVLVAYADPDAGDKVRDLWLVHAACTAMIERSALVTTAFTVVGKQVLHVRDKYRARVDTTDGTPPSVKTLLKTADPIDVADPTYWSHWTKDFDYLYVLFTDPQYKNPDPARLVSLYAGARFALYRIVRPPEPAAVASLEVPRAPERNRVMFEQRLRAKPFFGRAMSERTGSIPDQLPDQSRSLKR